MRPISQFMTKKVVAIRADMPLTDAMKIILKTKFNGLPVVDVENRVVGILTEYDLVTTGGKIHLPTLLKLMDEIGLYKKDKLLLKDDLKELFALKVRDAMNKEPITLKFDAPIEEAAKTFAEHHRVNPIVIVDAQEKLSGVLSRCDLIRLYAGVTLPSLASGHPSERQIDSDVEGLVNSFEKDFVFVSKFRTHFWWIISALFLIVGFIIAFALIVRIT